MCGLTHTPETLENILATLSEFEFSNPPWSKMNIVSNLSSDINKDQERRVWEGNDDEMITGEEGRQFMQHTDSDRQTDRGK